MLYALAAATGAARAFEAPSLQALLPSLVPQAAYPRAAALSASVFQCASIAGPSLGGLLYGAGPGVAYRACAAAFALAAACSARLPARVRVASQPPPTLASFFEGVGFVARRPDVLGAISLDLFAVLLGGATALLPVFAGGVLHAGPIGLGLLRAAPGAGALVVSLRPVAPAALAPSRTGHVLGGRRVRRGHHRVRPVDLPAALGRQPGHAGRGGRGQRRHPLHPRADAHAR